MEKKSAHSKQIKNRPTLPKAPPLHEEPLRGIDPSKVTCEICGRPFANKGQLNRHMMNEHESPEGKE
jgi:DNA-binding transcriptional regulator LsrR (DeoR family)